MKMTRLEWRYLQRIALDHPYFDTHKLPLTEKEAKAIVEANIKMTGREFVDSVYAKLGMTRPQEEKKRFAWLHNIGELFTVPPIRRIAIAVLVVVLMTVFFTATPTGRAIAESVIHYITTLLEDGSLVVNRNDSVEIPNIVNYDGFTVEDAQEQIENATNYVYIDSFDEFTKATGRTPFILPLSYTKLYYEYDEDIDYLAIYAIYDAENGKIVTYQVWDTADLVYSSKSEFQLFDAGEPVYYSTEEEGRIHCQMNFEDSVITITMEGSFKIDDLIHILKMKENR